MAHMSYCIPHRRELSDEERSLLRFLLKQEAPHRLTELESLKVIARCGCGKCPTVLLGASFEAEPATSHPFNEVAKYHARNKDGVLVGVVLIDRNGQLSELEAWSPEGEDIASWPSVVALAHFHAAHP